MQGLYLLGYESGALHAKRQARSSCNGQLDWLVVADWFFTETALFWQAPDMKPEEINAEFFSCLLRSSTKRSVRSITPAVGFSGAKRLLNRPENVSLTLTSSMMLWAEIRRLYAAEGGACPDQVLKANFNYTIDGKPDLRALCWALNGYDVKTGRRCLVMGSSRPMARQLVVSGFSPATTTTTMHVWIP